MISNRKGHKKGKRTRKFCVYTVYDNATDELICLDAEADKAAYAMGIKKISFFPIVTKTLKGKLNKWTIIRDFCDEIDKECDKLRMQATKNV